MQRGFGRGLPDRLATAKLGSDPSTNPRFRAETSGAVFGPLGGVIASASERHVESDSTRGLYEAWAHLDPSRQDQTPRYVPGLHARPKTPEKENVYIPGMDANPNYKSQNPNEPDDIKPKLPDPNLVSSFLAGTKNPISALTEYCTSMRLTVSFTEVPPLKTEKNVALQFASECKVNSTKFPQGLGRTKKEAKTAAAKKAFIMILGKDEDELEESSEADVKCIVDSFGRRVTIKSEEGQWKKSQQERRPLKPDEVLPQLNLDDESVAFDLQLRESRKDKHPVTVLENLCSQKSLPIVFDFKKNADGYVAQVLIDNRVVGEGFGTTTKLAKRNAADKALLTDPFASERFHQGTSTTEDMISSCFFLRHREAIVEIMQAGREHPAAKSVIDIDVLAEIPAAGFILRCGIGANATYDVVALGMGVNVANVMPSTDGRTVIDLHAFALARRSLVKFLLSEIRDFYKGRIANSIFELISGEDRLVLKKTNSLILFMTHPPTGDADVFARAEHFERYGEINRGDLENRYHHPHRGHAEEGKLRFKTESGETYPWDDPNDFKNEYPMSCSDKLLRCNVLGLQGALLSRLLRPVYVERVVLGSRYDHGVFSRAICCRVGDDLYPDQANGFRVNHPKIGRVVDYVADSRKRLRSAPLAVNWSADWHDDDPNKKKLEILDPSTGRSFSWSPFRTLKGNQISPSRLCKAAFFFRFKEVAREPFKSDVVNMTYHEVKETAVPYQAMKELFKENIKKKWGRWVEKPFEKIESFQK